jgi:hypothetical protein
MPRKIGGVVRKIMYQAIEVIINTTGKTQFQNLTQLQGAVITQMAIIPPKIAAYSAQTYDTVIPTKADYQAMFFTFMKGSDQVLENVPALVLNPFNDNDGAAATTVNNNPFWDVLFSPQEIDFQKSYVWMATAPSTAGIKVSIGVSYYYPNEMAANS